MKLLIKIGGALLDGEEARGQIARQIAAAARNVSVAAVHGAGRQLSRYLEEHGIKSHFINGLRVTTPEILDAVLKIVAGTVNTQLVAALNAAGARAVGISGIDAGMVEAEAMDAALGSVGRVVRADGSLLDELESRGFLPVVACIAGDRQGRLYNVNADQMAVACARVVRADMLVFLTDVEGVLDGRGQLVSQLTLPQSEALIARGIATGGMLAKLNAAHAALREGVPEVRIAAGTARGIIERILAGAEAGTRIQSAEAFTP